MCVYTCIYVYTSALTRLERGNANLFRFADLKKSADFNLRGVRQLDFNLRRFRQL